ncbi:MAG: hypothetical protein AB9917_16285 [Negativicutes bacterium]
MGLFDWLFGGGSKQESAPQKQPDPVVVAKATVVDIQPEAAEVALVSEELHPEIVAAIAAGIKCVMEMGGDSATMSAITAAIVHHGSGVHSVKINSARNAWALAGLNRLMDSRQFA